MGPIPDQPMALDDTTPLPCVHRDEDWEKQREHQTQQLRKIMLETTREIAIIEEDTTNGNT